LAAGVPAAPVSSARDLVTPQTMASVLRNLDAAGLVERRAHEWHHNIVETRLTDAGREALSLADEAASRIERRLADRFSAEERHTLRALLRRASEKLEEIAADQSDQTPLPSSKRHPRQTSSSSAASGSHDAGRR
jgi:DNA-binding HxlR family transcriptional regulator